jgi:hypothetical protein
MCKSNLFVLRPNGNWRNSLRCLRQSEATCHLPLATNYACRLCYRNKFHFFQVLWISQSLDNSFIRNPQLHRINIYILQYWFLWNTQLDPMEKLINLQHWLRMSSSISSCGINCDVNWHRIGVETFALCIWSR